jgi:uncharacterized membrane protein
MDFDLTEWLNLIVRWVHVLAGILWIGQTYFFTWLDGRFAELIAGNTGEKTDGKVWMVHSGGFYVVEKQKIPKLMPQRLHWFRWEAALTWLSGMTLLVLVYYFGGLMVNEHVSETNAIFAGILLLVVAWPLYDGLWRSRIVSDERIGVAVSYVLVVALAYGLTQVMDGRAAYIHMGGMFGTLMAVNVWARILPAQRRMVALLHEGKEPDLALAAQAKTRSKHNTYMVMPVVFIMISNHFPTATYGTSYNWLVLSLLVLIGWGAAKIVRRA